MHYGASLRHRRVDVMTGSERMLKAHHKNAVFHKTLEVKYKAYDATCHKNLSKVQQEINEVYYKEYVPLKEQAKQIQNRMPRIMNVHPASSWTKLATLPGNSVWTRTRLPEIHTLPLVSNRFREKQDNITAKLINNMTAKKLSRWKIEAKVTSKKETKLAQCYLSDSESDDMPYIADDRLKILKAAIALTSQPAKQPESRTERRRRNSYRYTLRSQNKLEWERDLLSRAGTRAQKENVTSAEQEPGTAKTEETERLSGLQQASLWKNKILNSDVERDVDDNDYIRDNDRLVLSRNSSSRASLTLGITSSASFFSTRNGGISVYSKDDTILLDSDSETHSVISKYTNSSFEL